MVKRAIAELAYEVAAIVATQYPDGMSDRGKAAYDRLVEGFQNESIYNVDFKPASETLARDFEKAEEKLLKSIGEPTTGIGRAIRDVSDSLTSLNSIKKIIRDHEKYLKKPTFPKYIRDPLDFYDAKEPTPEMVKHAKTMLAFFKSWAPAYQLRKEVKPFVIKGRKPSGKPPKDVYQPPASSRKSLTVINKMLTDLMAAKKSELEKSIFDQKTAQVESFIKNHDGKSPYRYYKYAADLAQLMNRVLDPVAENKLSSDWSKGARWKSDGKKQLASSSKHEAKTIAQIFVSKNMMKLTRIISEKQERSGAAITEAKELGTKFGRGVFEGHLYFAFSDGTEFTVKNQMVIKQNQYGTVFAQYPTTFHKVVFSDGSKKAKQSEKQMNELWVG